MGAMVEGPPAAREIPPTFRPPEKEPPVRLFATTAPAKDAPASPVPSGSRWRKLRTTVQLGSAVSAVHRRPPLKREDSFLKRFSTRPPGEGESQGPAEGEAADCSGRIVSGAVLNPDESPLFWWLWMVTACGLYYGWTLIVRQAFPELRLAHETLWLACDWFSDAVYLLDIAVQFRTGHLKQGIMVRDSGRLALHYLRSRDFFLDVAALVPLDFVQRWSGGDFPLLRFPRFLKARRIYRFYYAVESRTAYPNLWRVANLVHVLLLIAHWFGCFYYMLSELEGFQGAWAYRHPEHEASPLLRKYLGSVYWSTLTLTTIGDLATPATNLQYLFTIISYLIGVFIFATIVGQVGNVITNRNASRLEFERLLDGAKLYMRHHRVPKGMQRRVQRWYDYSWSRGRMQGGGDIHSALGILPDKLKTELAIHVNLKTLKKVTIFQECQPEFLHDLVLKMRAYIFTPGDLVCRKGEVAREMFIIADGILHVINDKGQVLTQMKAGDFFGEIGILNLDGFNRRTADVRSVGYSELFSLSREDVLSAMKDYPEAEEILQSMGRKRLVEARLNNSSDSDPFDRHADENLEKRQRKKGLSWATWLKSRGDPDQSAKNILSPKPKFPFSDERISDVKANYFDFNPPNIEDAKCRLSSDEQTTGSVVGHLTLKLKNSNRKRCLKSSKSLREKRSFWCKISGLIRMHRWKRTASLNLSELSERSSRGQSVPLQVTSSSRAISSSQTAQLERPDVTEERRTSWHPQKRSVSNWNRSELFSESLEQTQFSRDRRKTLAEGMILGNRIPQDYSSIRKSVPASLMTGAGLNAGRRMSVGPPPEPATPDLSPMSSNYSLSPSTSEEEEDEPEEEDPEVPLPVPMVGEPTFPPFSVKMQDYVSRIVQDLKSTMDSYIVETEKDMCLRILQLEKDIREKDDTISQLRIQHERKFGPEEGRRGAESVDSAICRIDIAPAEQVPEDSFHEEDLWLTEFPRKTSADPVAALAARRQKLRRHSSVEVGCRSPYFPLDGRGATRHPVPPPPPRSPRRFSESHARSDEVPLNTSFAARVRRVFAKVKASRSVEEEPARRSSISSPSEVQQQQHVRMAPALVRRLLPTITESSSFDSLRSVAGAQCIETVTLQVPEEDNR